MSGVTLLWPRERASATHASTSDARKSSRARPATAGVADATLPISSSACMSFLMRAAGKCDCSLEAEPASVPASCSVSDMLFQQHCPERRAKIKIFPLYIGAKDTAGHGGVACRASRPELCGRFAHALFPGQTSLSSSLPILRSSLLPSRSAEQSHTYCWKESLLYLAGQKHHHMVTVTG